MKKGALQLTILILSISLLLIVEIIAQNHWEKTNLTWTINSMAINSKDYIFIGTIGNVYYSKDDGQSWTSSNGLPYSFYSCFAETRSYIFVGNRDGQIFKSSNDGQNWILVKNDCGIVNSLASNARGDVFAGTREGVIKSTDYGENWEDLHYGIYNLGDDETEIVKVIDTGGGKEIIIAGINIGLLASKDDGNNWEFVLTNNNNGLLAPLCIEANNMSVFVGTSIDGIFISNDGGIRWYQSFRGLLDMRVFDIAISSNGDVFAGTENEGVFLRNNSKDHWISINDGLSDLSVFALAINSKNILFAGGGYGVSKLIFK